MSFNCPHFQQLREVFPGMRGGAIRTDVHEDPRTVLRTVTEGQPYPWLDEERALFLDWQIANGVITLDHTVAGSGVALGPGSGSTFGFDSLDQLRQGIDSAHESTMHIARRNACLLDVSERMRKELQANLRATDLKRDEYLRSRQYAEFMDYLNEFD